MVETPNLSFESQVSNLNFKSQIYIFDFLFLASWHLGVLALDPSWHLGVLALNPLWH